MFNTHKALFNMHKVISDIEKDISGYYRYKADMPSMAQSILNRAARILSQTGDAKQKDVATRVLDMMGSLYAAQLEE